MKTSLARIIHRAFIVPPVPPTLKGVIKALEQIRLESRGNAEIERLIDSIKAKLDGNP